MVLPLIKKKQKRTNNKEEEMKEDKKRREKKEENDVHGRTILYILYSKGVQTEGIIGAKKELLHFVRSSVREIFV